jgi:hypothetical protein
VCKNFKKSSGAKGLDKFQTSKLQYKLALVLAGYFSGTFQLFLLAANTGRFLTFSTITNFYTKKPKGITLMEFFTVTGKLKKFFFDK